MLKTKKIKNNYQKVYMSSENKNVNMIQVISGAELEELLFNNAQSAIFVVMTSAYLGDCRILLDILEELSEEVGGSVDFYNMDADDNEEYIAEKGIYQVPTMLMYSNSELVFYRQGLMSKSNLRGEIQMHAK
jgi:thioredoxin 1